MGMFRKENQLVLLRLLDNRRQQLNSSWNDEV